MAHALAADDAAGYQFAVLIYGCFAAAHALVFGVVRVDIFDRTENPLAEQSVAFRFLGSVVDGFRLGDFAVAPLQNVMRAGDRQAYGIKVGDVGTVVDVTACDSLGLLLFIFIVVIVIAAGHRQLRRRRLAGLLRPIFYRRRTHRRQSSSVTSML